MKLLNKLLPLSAATIVTPIVLTTTACSSFDYVWEFNEFWYDVGLKKGKLSEENATKAYFDDVKKNKKILAEDIATKVFNTIEHKKVSIKINNVDPAEKRLSVKVKFEIPNIEPGIKQTFILEIKKMKFVIVRMADQWRIQLDAFRKSDSEEQIQELAKDKFWSYSYKKIIKSKSFTNEVKHDCDSTNVGQIGFILDELQENFIFFSYYLSQTDVE